MLSQIASGQILPKHLFSVVQSYLKKLGRNISFNIKQCPAGYLPKLCPPPPVPPHVHQKYSVFNFSFTLSPGADCLQTLRVNPANWRIPLGAKNLFIFFRTKKIPIQISIHTIIFTPPL